MTYEIRIVFIDPWVIILVRGCIWSKVETCRVNKSPTESQQRLHTTVSSMLYYYRLLLILCLMLVEVRSEKTLESRLVAHNISF